MKALRRKDITDQELDKWIDEQREMFKSHSEDMDLVNICINALDSDKKTAKQKLQYRDRLREFYENQLCRGGNLLCDDCNMPLEVYYTVNCFHCEKHKPKVEKYEANYLMAVKYIGNNEEEFYGDSLWESLLNLEAIKGNDTYMKLPDHRKMKDDDYSEAMEIFIKHYPEVYDIKWFVSW